MSQPILISPGMKVNLAEFDPDDTGGRKKEAAQKETERLTARLGELQEVLWAENKRSVLLVFQAMDAGGKDGAIRNLLRDVNPQGCPVASFKVPSAEELSHDFLWRIHTQVPPRGTIGVFNRSHYEDVLVVRVHELVPEAVWRARYEQINDFEKLLTETGTTVLKFYLHISKKEQKERFEDRLREPEKNWKFSMGDVEERARWDDYMHAFEDALSRCSTPWAPWYVVPANNKWYRDLVVTRTVVEAIEAMDLRFPPPLPDRDKIVIP